MQGISSNNNNLFCRNAIINFSLIVFGLILACITVEFFVRAYKNNISYQPDENLIRSHRPNIERKIYSFDTKKTLQEVPKKLTKDYYGYLGIDRTNNLGFAMSDDVHEKAKNEKRILFFGDSFIEAKGVPNEQRFSELLQSVVDSEKTHQWKIINGAIQNGGPSQYLLQLRKYIETVEPDIVIVFTNAYDVVDDYFFENRFGFDFDEDGLPTRLKERFKLSLLKHVWSLRYFDVIAQRKSQTLDQLLWPNHLTIEKPDPLNFMCQTKTAQYEKWFFENKTGMYLLGLKKMANAHGAKFALVTYYYANYYNNEPMFHETEENLSDLKVHGCLTNRGAPYRDFIRNFSVKNDTVLLDLDKDFLNAKKYDPKTKLYNYDDYHFSPAGHTLVAESLKRFLSHSFSVPFKNAFSF